MDYGTHFGTRQTPQSQPIPGTAQVENSAGGYSWAVDRWARLVRFLILGTEGGTYYASERAITQENATSALEAIKEDGLRVVRTVVEISKAGRAPKNDPALYVLAMASAHGDEPTRAAAFAALPEVARIGTHLFHFCQYRQAFGGWGRGMRRAIRAWYTARGRNAERAVDRDGLALQLIKYRQRDGWSHRDVLRKSHPHPGRTPEVGDLLAWAAGKGTTDHVLVAAFEQAQATKDRAELIRLITDHRLPREAIPTEWLDEKAVWDALLPGMFPEALIRSLGVMGKVGLLVPMSEAARTVVAKIHDVDALRRSRLHPLKILAAHGVYGRGAGLRGSNTWPVVTQVVDALDGAFYKAFPNVQPTFKRHLLGIDVSGSMDWDSSRVGKVGGITSRHAAAAMAMVAARTEPWTASMAFSDGMREFPIGKTTSLAEVANRMARMPAGGTDCALPMIYALQNKIPVDAFVVYTDNETWRGTIHPAQALRQYRERMGIPAKLIVVGMVANDFTIADPNDSGMMDVVGFDTAAPAVMADFVRGTAPQREGQQEEDDGQEA